MARIRAKNKCICYLRRSTGKQETSLIQQLEWCIAAAKTHEVEMDACKEDLEFMAANNIWSYKSIYYDSGISGSNMKRQGFLAFFNEGMSNRDVSHMAFYKRDRIARPRSALDAAQNESKLTDVGITLIHSDGVVAPENGWGQNLLKSIEPVIAFALSAEEIRKLSERILIVQNRLASQGYRVGGNAPYGFMRILVNSNNEIIEELPPGKTVKQAGCHVRLMPKDEFKIGVWRQILNWRCDGWGFQRIANELNDRGIPSPDHGRIRTDRGLKHLVSGRWTTGTIREMCSNSIMIGIQAYGKRSEGKIHRLAENGFRVAELETDFRNGDFEAPQVIKNDQSIQIHREVGDALFDKDRWHEIQKITKMRGNVQAGRGRAKEPGKYPLTGCLFDLTSKCGSPMYGLSAQQRVVYKCGRYMKTKGAECHHNQVDADAILKCTLSTLKGLLEAHGGRESLKDKLMVRAGNCNSDPQADFEARELLATQGKCSVLREELQTVTKRMAREKNDDLAAAFAEEFKQMKAELRIAEANLVRLAATKSNNRMNGPEFQVDAALAIYDEILNVVNNPTAREKINPMLKNLGIKIGLLFEPKIKGKKRLVQSLAGAVLVFGNAPFYDAGHEQQSAGIEEIQAKAEKDLAHYARKLLSGTSRSQSECNPLGFTQSLTVKDVLESNFQTVGGENNQQLGVSLTSSNRGDWI